MQGKQDPILYVYTALMEKVILNAIKVVCFFKVVVLPPFSVHAQKVVSTNRWRKYIIYRQMNKDNIVG